MMKTKLISITLAALLLCAGVGTTLSYFTDSQQVHNVITTGGVRVAIDEWQSINGELSPYPNEPIEVMPGTTVSKIVTVENLDSDAFVRALYNVTFYDQNGNIMDISENELSTLIEVAVDQNTWKVGDDGWYYYRLPLEKGEHTTPFFEEAVFADFEMGNEFQHTTAIITVSVQAVQCANNADNAEDAWGWPEA